MKVLILCGGYGSRLGGAGGDLPKPMVPIGGKPIVWHVMKGFAQHGFREFVLCLGYRSDVFKQYFLNLSSMLGDVTVEMGSGRPPLVHGSTEEDRWKITLAETGLDSLTGHRLRRALPYLATEDECFALTYGDGVTDLDFRRVVEFHQRHGKLGTVTAVHPPARFGELGIRTGGRVDEFNEKPQTTAGWISGGFFVFSRGFLDYLPDDPRLVLELEPLKRLAQDGQLMAYQHDGFWACMDTPRDYQQLTDLWSSGRAPWATWERA